MAKRTPSPEVATPSLRKIRHVHLRLPKQTDPIVQLAEKARLVLGYQGSFIANRVVGSLGVVLAELEIEPLDARQVRTYKRQRVVAEKKRKPFRAGYERKAQWKSVPLRGYKNEVPHFVLSKAIQIAEKLPEAVFKVEELRVSHKLLDPFLTVEHKGEKFWIEVWEEKGFEDMLVDKR